MEPAATLWILVQRSLLSVISHKKSVCERWKTNSTTKHIFGTFLTVLTPLSYIVPKSLDMSMRYNDCQ
mgnify:FL=1